MPKKKQQKRSSGKFTMRITGWQDTGPCPSIWRAGAAIAARLPCINIWNTEMGLYSLVRPKKPGYRCGKPHKVFENKLKQEFHAEQANHKWCTDFTYLFLKNGEVRYNCSIVDLHDWSVIASVTDRRNTSGLAIWTLKRALETQSQVKEELILHSDQRSQYTPKAFVKFCEYVHVNQSMSRAGCPYDNAFMESYFITLKNEYVNLYDF